MFFPWQTRSARSETIRRSCIPLTRRHSREVFLLGFNTLFYMLPCLLHLIIFSLFRYTGKQPTTHGREKNSLPFNVILYFPLSRRFHIQCYVIREANFLEAVLMMFEKPLQCISSNFMKILNFPVGCRDCLIPVLCFRSQNCWFRVIWTSQKVQHNH